MTSTSLERQVSPHGRRRAYIEKGGGRQKREILEIYKYQPYLEKRFALTKSEYRVAPVFLKKPRRVVALLDVYFVAIMLAALLERQVRSAMRRRDMTKIPILPEGRSTATPTAPRILENFADASWHSFREGDRSINSPVELSAAGSVLLDLADVPRELYRSLADLTPVVG